MQQIESEVKASYSKLYKKHPTKIEDEHHLAFPKCPIAIVKRKILSCRIVENINFVKNSKTLKNDGLTKKFNSLVS